MLPSFKKVKEIITLINKTQSHNPPELKLVYIFRKEVKIVQNIFFSS